MLKNFSKIVSIVATVVITALATSAQAEAVYTFSLPGTGPLNGNDSWNQVNNISGTSLFVDNNIEGWSGNVLQAEGDSASYRVNNTAWSYSIKAGEDFDVSAEFNVTRGSYFTNFVGLQNSTTAGGAYGYSGMVFGINNGYVAWYNNGTGSGQYLKPTLANVIDINTEYKFLVGFRYTASTGMIDCYYQNLSDSEANEVSVGTMSLATDPSQWNQLIVRQNWGTSTIFRPNTKVDNITISQGAVPEPSSLVLLVAGLAGLTAYAWRKWK